MMEEYAYIEILIEDQSGAVLVKQIMDKYVQDSVVGTWEYLADIVYKGGLQALKRNASSYYEIGMFKCECARNIGALLNIRRNVSPSFQYFIGKLDGFCKENI